MRKYSVREEKVPFHLGKTVNAMICYPFPMFLVIYRSGDKLTTRIPPSIETLETTSQQIKLTSCRSYHSYATLAFSFSI